MVAALVIGVLVGVLVAGDSNGGPQTTVISGGTQTITQTQTSPPSTVTNTVTVTETAPPPSCSRTGQTAASGYAASMAACVLIISCMV